MIKEQFERLLEPERLVSEHTIFLAVFIRDHFFMLQSMLYFPESERETGKLKKVQYIVKHFIEQFWFYYMSKREVIIDESLMSFEDWARAIQYKPNKHHPHFGFKLFGLCENDIGYTVNFLIYEGKSNSQWVWSITWCVYQTYGTVARYEISFVYGQLIYCSATCWSIIIQRHKP